VRLAELDPDFAAQLQRRLGLLRDPGLAQAAAELRVVDRCRCDSPNCASFYTVEPFHARWLWLRGGRTIRLKAGLAVDAVRDRIVAVEVHGRPTLREALDQRWPLEQRP
jgi:hypothetical protein